MVNEFARLLKGFLSDIVNIIGSPDWDRKSYESVVNCLLLNDSIAVKEAIDHLVDEGKLLAIPPIYLTSQRHPTLSVRNYSWQSLAKLESHQKISQIVQGKNLEESIHALIEEYGHYKTDYHT